jgi:hypothetical protein
MPRKSSTSRRWPVVVKVGSAEAKIYRHQKGGGEYFILSYYEGTRRKLKWFSDYQAAKTEADTVTIKIANGQIAALELSGADRESYLHAQQLLKQLGVPLHSAVEEFVAAKKILGTHPMLHAVRDYVDRHKEKLAPLVSCRVGRVDAHAAKAPAATDHRQQPVAVLVEHPQAHTLSPGGRFGEALGQRKT